jgi:hypothetical protein
MARSKSLEQTEREIVVVAHGEIWTKAKETSTGGRDEALVLSDDEGTVSSGGDSGGSVDEGAR